MWRMHIVQPKSGHPEDTLPQWNVTENPACAIGVGTQREQSRAMQKSFSRLGLSICQDCEEALGT